MTRLTQDQGMGIAIVAVCLLILMRERWFLSETKKGQRLVTWLGPVRAIWALRGILGLIAAVGALLASEIIRPIRWQ